MALATRCPHCKTTFRVASDQLKLRGGIVRCGTCQQVFDGNATLIDLDGPPSMLAPVPEPEAAQAEPQQAAAVQAEAVPAAAVQAEAVQAAAVQAEVAQAVAVQAAAPQPESPQAALPAAPDAPSASAAFDLEIAAIESGKPLVLAPGYVLDFDLSDPVCFGLLPEPEPVHEHEPDQPDPDEIDLLPHGELDLSHLDHPHLDELDLPLIDAFGVLDEPDPPQREALPELGELSLADEFGAAFSSVETRPGAHEAEPDIGPLPLLRAASGAADQPFERSRVIPVAPVHVAEVEHDEPAFVTLARDMEHDARRRRIMMGLGSVVLTLVLLGQGLTTFRNVLVAKYPVLKPAVSGACALLRCKVELPAQIETLSIEAGDLSSLSGGGYQLTTLLRNESGLTQAWPHIELDLTDANDKPLVRRVFTPAQYLPAGVEVAKGFVAHSEQPVKIHFELKQMKASGFHMAVFYP